MSTGLAAAFELRDLITVLRDHRPDLTIVVKAGTGCVVSVDLETLDYVERHGRHPIDELRMWEGCPECGRPTVWSERHGDHVHLFGGACGLVLAATDSVDDPRPGEA